MVRDERTRHNLGKTRTECHISWRPWERYDYRAIRRGEWWIRFHPHPMYAYVAKRRNGDFLIIDPIPPYVTAPTHPHVYDLVAAQIPQGY